MLEELCRLCGNKNDDTLDIFSEIGSNQELELKIKQTIRLNVSRDDPLPNVICVTCIKNLENASSFIHHCHQTQTYLSQLYQNGTPSNHITDTFNELYNGEKSTDEFYIETAQSALKLPQLEKPKTNCNIKQTNSEYHNDNNAQIEASNTSITKSEDNFITLISNNEYGDPETKKVIINEVFIIEDNFNDSKTRSSNDINSKSTLGNTTNTRKQLKRKCTSQVVPRNNQYNASDDSNHALDELSADSWDLTSDDDDDDEFLDQYAKNNFQISNQQPTTSSQNSHRNTYPKNCTTNIYPALKVSKTNVKENEVSRKESKDKKRFYCATCKKSFTQELTFQEHLNIHTGNRPFSCKLCAASFRMRQELNQHLRTIHSEKQFKCPSCDHVAKHKGKLTEHIKSVHDKPFACDLCAYRTGEKGKISQHIANKHTSNLSYVCEICGNGFKTRNSLQVHIRNIHFPEPKVCQICGTVCPSLARYSAHVFRCGKEKKRYECEKCGQTYVNKEILRDHMNKHLNVKPYKCEVCGKAFFQRNRLDTHKYVHRGANYQCEICSQSFNRKDNMKNHMKRHFYKSMRCDDTIVTAV